MALSLTILGQGQQHGRADTATPGLGQDPRADESARQVRTVRYAGAHDPAVLLGEKQQSAGPLHRTQLCHSGGTLAGLDCDADLAPQLEISVGLGNTQRKHGRQTIAGRPPGQRIIQEYDLREWLRSGHEMYVMAHLPGRVAGWPRVRRRTMVLMPGQRIMASEVAGSRSLSR